MEYLHIYNGGWHSSKHKIHGCFIFCTGFKKRFLNFLYSSSFKETPSTSSDYQEESQTPSETQDGGLRLQEEGTGNDPYLLPANPEAENTDDKKGSASLTVVKLSILLK